MPKKYTYNPRLDLSVESKELIDKAARDEGKTVAAWIRGLIEEKLEVSFNLRTQAPHGEGMRRKKI
jgi:predicted DNA-binding protein